MIVVGMYIGAVSRKARGDGISLWHSQSAHEEAFADYGTVALVRT
jgi:hypothetical protein